MKNDRVHILIVGKGDTLLFVQDRNMPLQEPTHANVLVPVYGNDASFLAS